MDNDIHPVGQPEVKIDEISEEVLKLTVTAPVAPEVKLGQYKGLEVKKTQVKVTKKEIEAELKNYQNQFAELVIKEEGQVENGDTAVIDFEGFKDGVAFEGGSAKGHKLEIGSNQFIPGFEDQMIGMKQGETRDLNLTFPENYGVSDLAGADVVFKVTVHKIETKKDAMLNDEFVAGLNIPSIETVEQLHESVKANIKNHHDQAYQGQKENAAFDQVLSNSEVEISEDDLQKAIEKYIEHVKMQLAQQGMQLEQYLQMMNMDHEAFKKQIVKLENIQTTDEEVQQQLEKIALYNNTSKEEVLKHVEPENLRNDFNRVKASQLIIESAVVIE